MYKYSRESIERCINAIGRRRENTGIIAGNETIMYNPISKECHCGEWIGKVNNTYNKISGYIEIDITKFRSDIKPNTDESVVFEVYDFANQIIKNTRRVNND